MPSSDPGLIVGILTNTLVFSLPLFAIAAVALIRARNAAAPGLVRTSAVLFLCTGLFTALFQVVWAVFPHAVSDPLAVLPLIGLVQGVLIGLLTTGALLCLVLALWRARTPARPVPARGGHGGDGYVPTGADTAAPAHYAGDHGHRSDGPGAPPAHGQPGDPGAAPSHGSHGSSGSSGGGFWGGLFGGDSGGGGWGGDSGGGGGDGGGGGGGGD